MCTGCWGSKKAVLQWLTTTPPCDWAPGALKSAYRPSWTRIARSNPLHWNNGPWTLLPVFHPRSLLPPLAAWLNSHSRSTSVLAIQCCLRCCIPMYETHCLSPVLLGVAYPDQRYQGREKGYQGSRELYILQWSRELYILQWTDAVQVTSQVYVLWLQIKEMVDRERKGVFLARLTAYSVWAHWPSVCKK